MIRSILSALFLALFIGCSSTNTFTGECTEDAQCPVGAICRAGLCACRSDEACGVGEFCNKQGICQKREGCRTNADCAAAEFCDLATGACLPRTACGSEVHCELGTVCDRARDACVVGCYDNGDCPLYSVCNRPAGAAIGSCLAGTCDDSNFCDYGSRCQNMSCVRDTNPNHCAPCNNMRGDCGGGGNFCLINTGYDPNDPSTGTEYFCGVECDPRADSCPNGYSCVTIVLLTGDLCTNDQQCGPGRRCQIDEGDPRGACTCAVDADCGTDTVPPTCAGSCGGLGVQACTRDDECFTTCEFACQWPQGRACTNDSQCEPLPICAPIGPGGQNACITNGLPCTQASDCLCVGGQCANTGRACTTGADCSLRCENGGCVLGSACGPNPGLSCEDLR